MARSLLTRPRRLAALVGLGLLTNAAVVLALSSVNFEWGSPSTGPDEHPTASFLTERAVILRDTPRRSLGVTRDMLWMEYLNAPADTAAPTVEVDLGGLAGSVRCRVDTRGPFLASPADVLHANTCHVDRVGLPFRSAWTASYSARTDCLGQDLGTKRWFGFRRPLVGGKEWFWQGFGSESGFPTGVLPLGLTANTAIYAGAWQALFIGVAAIRRGRAAHRGLCPHCRYDRAGIPSNAPCPECGTMTTDRA